MWKRLYGEEASKLFKYKFNVGDQVRISKARQMFKKDYLHSWTEEYLRLQSEYVENPLCIKLRIYHGDELD